MTQADEARELPLKMLTPHQSGGVLLGGYQAPHDMRSLDASQLKSHTAATRLASVAFARYALPGPKQGRAEA